MTINYEHKYKELTNKIDEFIKSQKIVLADIKDQINEGDVSAKREAYYLASKSMLNKIITIINEET